MIAALLLGYAAYIYFSGKGFNSAWLKHLWQMLRERWTQFFGAYQDWRMTHLNFSRERKEGQRSNPLGNLSSWLRLRNLDPDQQVRYYYFSTLHRAEQAGMARRDFETPNLYAPRLAARVAQTPEDEAAIAELTDAFVRIRYAGQHADQDHLPRLKTLWNHVRALLRKPSSSSSSQEQEVPQSDG
ncbi:MAG: DUF4129 domain-containing protein [Caldilineaceae bacterium]|nr:DUF4129 domain-containing protein [Caldilineaceae bacterium]